MKKIILLFATCLVAGWIYGQGEMDAFRLSGTDISGTARGVAMGGAFGALGGDITGVIQNPAGIGVYRSSEIVTSLSLAFVNTKTNTLETIGKDSRFNFNFDNFAYIGYMPLAGDISAFNFGFSYNRLKNFGRNYYAKGNGLTSSLTDYIANFTTWQNIPESVLNGSNPYNNAPWLSVLGYRGGLIRYDREDEYGHLYASILHNDELVNREFIVSERGRIDAYDFTMGMNISDVVYLGMKFSLTDMRYSLISRHTEEFELGGGFDLDNSLETSGAGYQVSVGAIIRPVDELRLGVSYHSPTWYNLSDFYFANTKIDYDTDDGWFHAIENTPRRASDYQLRTPDRWVVSAAGVLGGKAILSLDYEYSDYSKMRLGDNSFFNDTFREQNEFISEDFIGASTVKAGLEYRVTPQLALRAGYAWMQSPLEESFKAGEKEVDSMGTVTAYTLDGDTQYYSCGVGYRFTPNFYMDFALSYKTQTSQLYTYSPSERLDVSSDPSELKSNTFKGILTLGYRF